MLNKQDGDCIASSYELQQTQGKSWLQTSGWVTILDKANQVLLCLITALRVNLT